MSGLLGATTGLVILANPREQWFVEAIWPAEESALNADGKALGQSYNQLNLSATLQGRDEID